MKLPNLGKAIISPQKLHGYLLSPVHSVGRHKSAFFRSLGYTQDKWETLERDLRAIAAADAEFIEATDYGRKYEIRGSLTGPNGKTAAIVTAWIVLNGESVARFITAYPETQR